MSLENINIGEAELEIMKVLWEAEKPVNSQYISSKVEEKGWKRTTILTFLSRLVEKGAISSQKDGKSYFYTPIISQKEYRKAKTKNLIMSLYNGSVKDFALSFFEEQSISDKDLEELRSIFQNKEE